MTNHEFAAKLKDAAARRTLYIKGCFGAPMTAKNKSRYSANNDYNKKRAAMINAAAEDTFGFDCVCLVKGVLWGWCADVSQNYGGAKYASNGVKDLGTEEIIDVCKDVSTDFADVAVGELLWMKGHVGAYIGGGLAVECTPAWKNGVQITAVGNIGKKAGYNARTWTKHGKLPYVEYAAEPTSAPAPEPEKPAPEPEGPAPEPEAKPENGGVKTVSVSVPVIKKGVKSDAVRAMQALLNMRDGAGLDIDGSCGIKTDSAIRAYQSSHGLDVDGSCGRATWTKLING